MHSSVHQTETRIFFALLQLVVMIMAARLAGSIAQHPSRSRAVGE